jgi:hypothetical protein
MGNETQHPPKAAVERTSTTSKEWLFPNRRVSITRLPLPDEEEKIDGFERMNTAKNEQRRMGKRRVHFGICERLEYDPDAGGEAEEEGKREDQQKENIDPAAKMQHKCRQRRRRASIPAVGEMEGGGGGIGGQYSHQQMKPEPMGMISTDQPAAELSNKGRMSSQSILAFSLIQGGNKEKQQEKDGSGGKYNALIFRLVSSLYNSKM